MKRSVPVYVYTVNVDSCYNEAWGYFSVSPKTELTCRFERNSIVMYTDKVGLNLKYTFENQVLNHITYFFLQCKCHADCRCHKTGSYQMYDPVCMRVDFQPSGWKLLLFLAHQLSWVKNLRYNVVYWNRHIIQSAKRKLCIHQLNITK